MIWSDFCPAYSIFVELWLTLYGSALGDVLKRKLFRVLCIFLYFGSNYAYCAKAVNVFRNGKITADIQVLMFPIQRAAISDHNT